MLYSRFIYEAAVAASDYGDSSMNYEDFIMGKMAEIEDYAPYLAKTYYHANAFFQRLSALGKVISKTVSYDIDDSSDIALPDDVSSVIAVVTPKNGKFYSVPFRQGRNDLTLLAGNMSGKTIIVQYLSKIPFLSSKDILFIDEYPASNGNVLYKAYETENRAYALYADFYDAFAEVEAHQIELLDYGISELACAVGIDWIRGRLNDNDSTGHSQEMEAESRLLDLPDDIELSQKRTGEIPL